MDLSITSLSTSYNQASNIKSVGEAMLAKTLDTNESVGQGIVNMIDSAAMERSVNPAVGSNFDMSV